MKNTIAWVFNLLLLAGIAGLYYLHFSDTKEELVYVDSMLLINEYEGMMDARKEYQVKAKVWQVNVDTLVSEVQQSIKTYEKDSRGMSNKEKELSKQLIKNKQEQLMGYQKAIQEQAQQEDMQMTQTVMTEINNYLKEYGKKNGFEIILAATEAGNIAYANEKKDITKDVLAGLNNRYRGE